MSTFRANTVEDEDPTHRQVVLGGMLDAYEKVATLYDHLAAQFTDQEMPVAMVEFAISFTGLMNDVIEEIDALNGYEAASRQPH